MPKKWFTYAVLPFAILLNIYVESIVYRAFAGEIVQYTETSADGIEDLKQELKHQKQMQTLKNRLDTTGVQSATTRDEEIKPTLIETKYIWSIKSRDSNYSLNIGSLVHLRYVFKDKDKDFDETDSMDLTLRRARLNFGGNVYSKDIHYYVQLSADEFTLQLKNLYVFWAPLDEFHARIGYFTVPFIKQRMTSSSRILLQDRSIAANFFTQDRDYGLDIYGHPFDGRMEYHAAVFLGVSEDPMRWDIGDNIDNKLIYVLNLRYNPLGLYDYYDETDIRYSDTLKATIGTAVVFHGKVDNEKNRDADTIIGAVDFGIKYRGLSWKNEYYIRTVNPEDGDTINSDGFFTQIGYFIIPKKLELAFRYSQFDPDKGMPDDLQKEYSFGLNYYFRTHRSKIQTDISHFVTDWRTD
jgi:phosphate-selective porin OprO and OprP